MSQQGLSTKGPITRSSSTLPSGLRLFTQEITVAGVLPTAAEIKTALEAAYATAATTPQAGDIVNLTDDTPLVKLRTTVTATGTASGVWVVLFTVGSVNYMGNQVQTGLY